MNDLKNYETDIEDITKIVDKLHGCCRQCQMDMYDCTCRIELNERIEYIKKKFIITKEDMIRHYKK